MKPNTDLEIIAGHLQGLRWMIQETPAGDIAIGISRVEVPTRGPLHVGVYSHNGLHIVSYYADALCDATCQRLGEKTKDFALRVRARAHGVYSKWQVLGPGAPKNATDAWMKWRGKHRDGGR